MFAVDHEIVLFPFSEKLHLKEFMTLPLAEQIVILYSPGNGIRARILEVFTFWIANCFIAL